MLLSIRYDMAPRLACSGRYNNSLYNNMGFCNNNHK